MRRSVIVLAAVLALAGCSATPNPGHNQWCQKLWVQPEYRYATDDGVLVIVPNGGDLTSDMYSAGLEDEQWAAECRRLVEDYQQITGE